MQGQQHVEIPSAITAAVTAMLQPYSPGLTSERLARVIAFQPEEPEQEKLLTRKEAACALHISLPTLDRMLRGGEIQKVRVRGRAFVRQSAINRIIKGEVAA